MEKCNFASVDEKRYNDYGSWLRKRFPFRVQKLRVDAGFSCPNRDGTKGSGGCVFCDNHAFSPTYCDRSKSIRQQLADGKAFFGRKYSSMKYLAYFQAYSNTYADVEKLRERYEEALERYHKAEEIYVTNHKEHICMDHLQAQARIYEILGKYEDAIRYVELQIKYLEEEWNITEGADVDALQEEKRRLIEKIK